MADSWIIKLTSPGSSEHLSGADPRGVAFLQSDDSFAIRWWRVAVGAGLGPRKKGWYGIRLAGVILPRLPSLRTVYRSGREREPNKLPKFTGKYFPGNRQSLPDLAPIQFVTIISIVRQD